MRVIIGWLINAVALIAVSYLLKSVTVASFGTALMVALVIGLLNILIKPILFILTLPVTILTLGLFTFVLNGLMFWLASRLVDGFSVSSFGMAIVAAVVYSIISWAISSLLIPARRID